MLPGTLALASNTALLSAVPYSMGAGVLHVMAGAVVVVPAAVMLTCAEEPKVCAVEPAVDEDWPAATTMTYAACTVKVPGALLASTPLPSVANEGLDSVHCVPEVTSCVEPLLRWAMACRVTAPPTLTVAGEALTVRKFRLVDEGGVPHPTKRMNKALTNSEHTRGIRGKRIYCLVNVRNFEASRPGDKGHRAQAAVRVVETRCSAGENSCFYFGATFAHRRGILQSHPRGIT